MVAVPSETLTFWRDAIIQGGKVFAWPGIVLILLIAFGNRIGKLADQLLARMATARRLKIWSVWEDELEDKVKEVLSEGERLPAIHHEELTEHASAKDEIAAEVVEPAAPGETTRQTLVRVIAAAAAKSFRLWRKVSD